MASKESSRSSGALALLMKFRDTPPTILELKESELASYKVQNGALLLRIKSVDGQKQKLTQLLEVCQSLQRTVLAIDAVRFNNYGKFEVRLVDMVNSLKSLKATPEELEKLSWAGFAANAPEQKDFLSKAINDTLDSLNGKLPAPGFAIRLIDITFGKNNGFGDGVHDPVFGKWQICVFPVASNLTPAASEKSVSKEKDPNAPPPAKRSRKSKGGSSSDSTSPKDGGTPADTERDPAAEEEEEPVRAF